MYTEILPPRSTHQKKDEADFFVIYYPPRISENFQDRSDFHNRIGIPYLSLWTQTHHYLHGKKRKGACKLKKIVTAIYVFVVDAHTSYNLRCTQLIVNHQVHTES